LLAIGKKLSITALFSQDASTFSTRFILFVFETFQVELYFLPVAFCLSHKVYLSKSRWLCQNEHHLINCLHFCQCSLFKDDQLRLINGGDGSEATIFKVQANYFVPGFVSSIIQSVASIKPSWIIFLQTLC